MPKPKKVNKDSKEFPQDLFVQHMTGESGVYIATHKKDNLNPEDGVNVGIYALTGILKVKKTVVLE
jgi:hypothetical protein